jgi:hypothetical protein
MGNEMKVYDVTIIGGGPKAYIVPEKELKPIYSTTHF